MKYFKLQETPEFKHGSEIKNWYGTFDVRDQMGVEIQKEEMEKSIF